MGIPLSDFYQMTPREFFIYQEGFSERRKADEKLQVQQAYLISRWVWAKKVDIEKMLNDQKVKREMTDDEIFRQVKILNAMLGGEVKEVGKE